VNNKFVRKADIRSDRSAHRAWQIPISFDGVGWKGTKAPFTKSLEFEDRSLYCLGEFTTES
jgi:hypothetical protein